MKETDIQSTGKSSFPVFKLEIPGLLPGEKITFVSNDYAQFTDYRDKLCLQIHGMPPPARKPKQ